MALSRYKIQHRRINAIARLTIGAVVKYMPEVNAGDRGQYLGSYHAMAIVGAGGDGAGYWPGKRQPTGTGIKAIFGIKQCCAA